VRELTIAPRTWRAAEAALGRSLTAPERERIADALALHRHFIGTARALRVPAQSQKRTLAAAAALPLDQIAKAFARMDESTHLCIVNELHRAGARTADELTRPAPEALRGAAAAAVANWQPTTGGHPAAAPRMLARVVAQIWRDLGGADCAPAARAGRATPLVRFAVVLFEAAGAPRSESAIAKLLREAREG